MCPCAGRARRCALAVRQFSDQPTCSAMCLGISPKLSELMRWSMLCRAPALAKDISPLARLRRWSGAGARGGVPAGCCSCPQMLLPSAEGCPSLPGDMAAAGEAAAAAEGVAGSEGPGLPRVALQLLEQLLCQLPLTLQQQH